MDGADKVRNMSDKNTVNRKVLSFSINCTSFKSYTQMALTFMQTVMCEKSFKGKSIAEIAY